MTLDIKSSPFQVELEDKMVFACLLFWAKAEGIATGSGCASFNMACSFSVVPGDT